ncbi:hypothetical protein HPP92_024085 [Vanilla planifolia]|uniref:Uncharacterized protein n=1 Tax=Vanilla planifolia TaxID=51239 RepID=A0A835UB44_VANPL|nr:hypothetical protein HPP92_024085 [Vanilla planifolia]
MELVNPNGHLRPCKSWLLSPVPPLKGSMAPSSDFSHAEAAENRRRRGPPFALLVPLIYAPILPLIRIGLRHKPVLRDRLFFGVLAGAFAHGTYLVYPHQFRVS